MERWTVDLISRNKDSAMVEAEELIQQWLDPPIRVHAWGDDSPIVSHQEFLGLEMGADESSWRQRSDEPSRKDFLSDLDWSEGDVRENVRAVVDGLMQKSLAKVQSGGHGKRKSHDPRITMEMRHKEVRDRRQLRDADRVRSVRSQQVVKEARREAERLVQKEEAERKRAAIREEALIRAQMAAVRRDMRAEEERRRALDSHLSSVAHHVLDPSDSEAVMRFAGECVKEGEVDRTRAELVRQLGDLEAAEMKNNLKLLHKYFSTWYTVVAAQRVRLGKAAAVSDWKLLLKVWKSWRGYVGGRRVRRERDALAREMQREKMHLDLAVRHHHHRLLLRCVSSWLHLTRSSRLLKEQEAQRVRQREKMAVFLQAAAEGRVGGVREGVKQVTREEPGAKEERTLAPVSRGPPDAIIWQTARHQLDKLLAEGAQRKNDKQSTDTAVTSSGSPPQMVVKPDVPSSGSPPQMVIKPDVPSSGSPPQMVVKPDVPSSQEQTTGITAVPQTELPEVTSGDHSATQTSGGSQSQQRSSVGQRRKPHSRPATKPIPMSGMESRSSEILRRREAREMRRQQMESERLAEFERLEAVRREAEKAEKEECLARRREERRAARQCELEKQLRFQRLAELTLKAQEHYDKTLLSSRGLRPWVKFVHMMRERYQRAQECHRSNIMKRAFLLWRERSECRVRERETRADGCYHTVLLRRGVQAWKKYVDHTHMLEELALSYQRVFLLRRVFHGWQRVSKEAMVLSWERERRAKMHHQRQLKRRVLNGWVRYVPLAREERSREIRREELRRKVTAWLPDYQPIKMV